MLKSPYKLVSEALECDPKSLNEKSGLNVTHINAKTPTPGNTFTAVEQIFLNLKRRRAAE